MSDNRIRADLPTALPVLPPPQRKRTPPNYAGLIGTIFLCVGFLMLFASVIWWTSIGRQPWEFGLPRDYTPIYVMFLLTVLCLGFGGVCLAIGLSNRRSSQ